MPDITRRGTLVRFECLIQQQIHTNRTGEGTSGVGNGIGTANLHTGRLGGLGTVEPELDVEERGWILSGTARRPWCGRSGEGMREQTPCGRRSTCCYRCGGAGPQLPILTWATSPCAAGVRSDVVGARAECREGRGRGAIDTGYFARELMEVNGGTGIASRFFSSVR